MLQIARLGMKREGVLGLGIDLVENDRMEAVIARWGRRFKDKVFTPEEQAYCDSKGFPAQHYAGRFAIKEAVTKALGTGMGPQVAWRDIEVERDEATGAPSVRLSLRVRRMIGRGRILVSLAHTRHYAVAQALWIELPVSTRGGKKK